MCVCGGGERGGVTVRNPNVVQALLIRRTRPPPSCQALRRTAPSRDSEHRLAGGSWCVYVAGVTRHVCWLHEVKGPFFQAARHKPQVCMGSTKCACAYAQANTNNCTLMIDDVSVWLLQTDTRTKECFATKIYFLKQQ